MTVAAEPAVSYDLHEDGPPIFEPAPSMCWWCGESGHPRGWRGCPLVVVDPCELTPERRRLRALLS